MIPKIIHFTAKTKNLSEDELLLWSKNKKVLNDWDFRLYDDADNLKIVEEYFPEHLEKYNKINKGVAKADIVRCMYLYVFGGLYADTDYRFLRPLTKELQEAVCVIPAEPWGTKETPFLGNCIFFSEKGYRFWKDYVNHVFDSLELETLTEDRIIAVTGPGGITDFYLENKESYPEILVPASEVFHPLLKWHHFRVKVTSKTIGVHFCFGSWRSKYSSLNFLYKLRQHIQSLGLLLYF